MKHVKRCLVLASALVMSTQVTASDALSSTTENVTRSHYGALLNTVSEMLRDNFVFPDIAPKYVNALAQCLEADCLANAKDDSDVAKQVTELLQQVYPDRHLRLYAAGERSSQKKKKQKQHNNGEATPKSKTGITEVKILEDNIGYIKITSFPGTKESIAATKDALMTVKNTNAVVFDIRQHRGGHPENISEIASFLFQQPTHMVTTRSPHSNNGKPEPHVSKPNEYAAEFKDKPVYLLTSENSASAAEHFAMSMKSTGRAILIGQTTGGYGHWGGIADVDGGFSLFVPMGRTYNPKNGLGWEGIGVTPDIMVEPSESLDFALQRIRAHL